MKILLLGGTGQVGTELRRSLAPLGEVVITTRDGQLPDGAPALALDLAEIARIAPLLARVHPDVVVNATAYTAVDRAETEPEAAFRINEQVPAELAAACATESATLVHLSTD